MLWKSIQIFSTIKYKHKRVNTAALKIPSNSIDDTAALVLLQLEYQVLPNDQSLWDGENKGERAIGNKLLPWDVLSWTFALLPTGRWLHGSQKARCLLTQPTCVCTSRLPLSEARMGMLLWFYAWDGMGRPISLMGFKWPLFLFLKPL